MLGVTIFYIRFLRLSIIGTNDKTKTDRDDPTFIENRYRLGFPAPAQENRIGNPPGLYPARGGAVNVIHILSGNEWSGDWVTIGKHFQE